MQTTRCIFVIFNFKPTKAKVHLKDCGSSSGGSGSSINSGTSSSSSKVVAVVVAAK